MPADPLREIVPADEVNISHRIARCVRRAAKLVHPDRAMLFDLIRPGPGEILGVFGWVSGRTVHDPSLTERGPILKRNKRRFIYAV
jgi:hypothetical protein